MYTEIGLLWMILGLIFIGIFWLFFALGEIITPKKSLITGKPRSKEEISKKGFRKGILLFLLALWIVGMVLASFIN